MPELPEVETIRLGLQKYLVGHTIEKVEVRLSKIIQGDVKDIIGAKVTGVRRFGKGLVIDLDNNYSIAIHIKLTGQIIYKDEKVSNVSEVSKEKVGSVPNKWTHVIFHLDRGGFLYYNDLRQFGWIRIVQSSKLKDESFFSDLGPEPLNNLTIQQFNNIISSSKTSIKPLLMDQKKISGIGNIYANDALFGAKIDPRRKAKSLTQEEVNRLYNSILTVLKRGLQYGGASELSYVNALGQEGEYQKHFLVYAQQGKPCKNCGTKIQKIKLLGRGTYFCPRCQQ